MSCPHPAPTHSHPSHSLGNSESTLKLGALQKASHTFSVFGERDSKRENTTPHAWGGRASFGMLIYWVCLILREGGTYLRMSVRKTL